MQTINDKTQALKSLAVWFPTVITFVLVILDTAMQTQLIPTAYIPAVVFVSGLLGRIIKQPNMRE